MNTLSSYLAECIIVRYIFLFFFHDYWYLCISINNQNILVILGVFPQIPTEYELFLYHGDIHNEKGIYTYAYSRPRTP